MKTTFFVLFSGICMPLAAGTVWVAADSYLPLDSGAASCRQSGAGPVSCTISATFSDPTGRRAAHADIAAQADFGLLSGRVDAGNDDGSLEALYQSSFGDCLTVLGGSGSGVLIAHYHLVSSDEQNRLPGRAVPPFYRFLQGAATVEYTPGLPLDTPIPFTLTEELDVAAPVVFGLPIPLAAGTRALIDPGFSSGRLATSSSAELTGYTVLDATGAPVDGAVVQRSFTTAPDAFLPEPGTVWTAAVGALLIFIGTRGSLDT